MSSVGVELVGVSRWGLGLMEDGWLEQFHAGERSTLEACYREYYRAVDRAVGRVLLGADRETVVHDVFLRLLSNAELRRNFAGGSLSAWLGTVARNQAIDFLRKHRRDQALAEELASAAETGPSAVESGADDAKMLVQRFREQLPAKWVGVFEARFVEQRSQRDAAAALGIHRTTLAYQESRIRSQLRRYLLESEAA